MGLECVMIIIDNSV